MAPTKPTKASSSADPSLSAKLAKNKRLPATMFPTPAHGQHQQSQASGSTSNTNLSSSVPTPATVGKGKSKKGAQESRKKRLKSELGREKALEREAVLAEKVKGREERKAKRNRAKNAWE